MSTSATVEKKTKKSTKKATTQEAKVETTPVQAQAQAVNDETSNGETSEINSSFYTLMDKVVASFNELNDFKYNILPFHKLSFEK